MDKKDKEILVDLTQTQARFLKELFRHKTITANASGASQVHFSGKIVAKLRKKGITEPMGFRGRQRQWTLTPGWEEKYKSDKEKADEILNKILGD